MQPRRILIVNVRSLLMDSVTSLLDANGSGTIALISTITTNASDLLQQIRRIQPSVIVLDETTSFVRPADLLAALTNFQNIRILALHSENNQLDIYDRAGMSILHPNQFIDVIKEERSPCVTTRRWIIDNGNRT
jgi:DNA-binding NarL/FixJ family response regulator